MNRRRSQLQAYFAGIIDGEGYIGIQTHSGTYTAQVSVQMDDPYAIMLLAREYPEGNVYYRLRQGGVPYYQWCVRHYKAERFLTDIEPFLVVKQEQCKVARSFLVHRHRVHANKRGVDCGGRCERLLTRCSELKRETRRVKTVDAWLDYGLREYRAKREDVETDVAACNALLQGLHEGVETSAEGSMPNKATSALEQDIVQA
jgi:hypothetical protein